MAEKRFTIHQAPTVLTVHLKRFSPLGRKISHPIGYPERLSLRGLVSEGQEGPSYRLFAVISHAGGGPNSGHYFAHVKCARGLWWEMNDDDTGRVHQAPLNRRNAYVLFYIRDDGLLPPHTMLPRQTPLTNGSIKRKMSDNNSSAAQGSSGNKPFIGPQLPSVLPGTEEPHPKRLKPDAREFKADARNPETERLTRKIDTMRQKPQVKEVKRSDALHSLAQYQDEDDAEQPPPATSPPAVDSSPLTALPESSPLKDPLALPTVSFYGTTSSTIPRKRSSPDPDEALRAYARTPLTPLLPESPRINAPNSRRYEAGTANPSPLTRKVKRYSRGFAV